MVDERIASENHPSASGSASDALNRAYADETAAGLQRHAVVQTGRQDSQAIPRIRENGDLSRIRAMSPAEARAEHAAAFADPGFMSRPSNSKKLAYLEAISERMHASAGDKYTIVDSRTGQPANPQLNNPNDPEDVKRFTNEIREIEEVRQEAELNDPEQLARFDAMYEPRSPAQYTGIEITPRGENEIAAGVAGRMGLMKLGVDPQAANYLASQHADYRTWMNDDTTWDAKVTAAIDVIKRHPGGARTLQDAHAFLKIVEDTPNHPHYDAAMMAACYPQGLRELARLHRRSQRGSQA